MSQESFGGSQCSVDVSRCSSENVLTRGACGIRRPTWQFDDEEMEKTPSVLDGMTLHEERQCRRDACEFVVLFAREINKQMRLSGVSVDERLYVLPLLLDINPPLLQLIDGRTVRDVVDAPHVHVPFVQ